MTPSFAWLVGIWGAVAAALTILYLIREQRPRLEVPFLGLFLADDRVTRREALGGRLRRPGSLLLQLLLLALLGCGLRECARRWDPSEETLVLVIDTSARAGVLVEPGSEAIVLDQVKHRAAAWLESLGPSDAAVVIEMSATPKVVLGRTTDFLLARRIIEGLRPKKTNASPERVLALAAAIASPGEKRVVVLTGDPDRLPSERGNEVVVDALPSSANSPNLSVRSFAARRVRGGAGQFEVTFELVYSGESEARVLVELERLDEKGRAAGVLEAQELRLTPRQTYRGELRHLTGAPGPLRLEARLLTGSETFLADNEAFAVLAEERLYKILCVGPESLYLDAALLSVARSHITHLSAEAYPPRDASENPVLYDLTVFSGEAPMRIRETGFALYLGASGPNLPVLTGTSLKMFGFDEFARDSRLFRFFDPYETLALKGVSLIPGASDRVLARSGDNPILVLGERPEGRFLALGFAPEDSDFVLRPAFPLFVRGAFEELFGPDDEGFVPAVAPGQPLRLALPEAGPGVVTLRGPLRGANSSEERSVTLASGELRVELEEAGLYQVEQSGRSLALIAVSLSGSDEVTSLRQGSKPPDAPPKAEELARVESPASEHGYRVWIALALALALFEFASFHRRWTA